MLELFKRSIGDVPAATDYYHDKPTLLICWFCTVYSLAIILVRLLGRWVRTEKVYLEDGIMMLAVVPLFIRMGFVHIILTHGTNNAVITALSNNDLSRREFGSKMVLVARIFYAMYLWAIKYSLSIFLKTLTASAWRRHHARILQYLHIFLLVTFLITVLIDLLACHPFSHNWQVVPDPGTQCRQNFAHLISTGVLDALTNLVLVLFPLPIIFGSRLPRKHKITILFRLAPSLLSVFLTFYTIPHNLTHHGQQTYRSLLASLSILLTTATANCVVLFSLLRDRGYKKPKFKHVIETNRVCSIAVQKRKTVADELSVNDRDELMRQSDKMMREALEMGVLRADEAEAVERLEAPARVKLGDIRVASSWDITIDEARPGPEGCGHANREEF